MGSLMTGMGLAGSLIFLVLIIVIPISIYAAQKWAYKCYKELLKTNALLTQIVEDRGIKQPETLPANQGIDIVRK